MPTPSSDPDGRAIRVRVPAKVNLYLGVGDRRADGYHDIITVFHAVDLYDELTAAPSDTLSLEIEGEGSGDLPTDDGNLVIRAAKLLARTAGVPARAELRLSKQIPVAGGMAGGSADAAAALVACAKLWDLDCGTEELTGLAAQLGSDVAFCLIGGTAIGTGRGEELFPIPCNLPLTFAFGFADFGISAADAYAQFDLIRSHDVWEPPIGTPDRLVSALEDGDFSRLNRAIGNDLESSAIALRDEIQELLSAGCDGGGVLGFVSGSGPTCAFLCRDEQDAQHVVDALLDNEYCRHAVIAHGPVSGAQVV